MLGVLYSGGGGGLGGGRGLAGLDSVSVEDGTNDVIRLERTSDGPGRTRSRVCRQSRPEVYNSQDESEGR